MPAECVPCTVYLQSIFGGSSFYPCGVCTQIDGERNEVTDVTDDVCRASVTARCLGDGVACVNVLWTDLCLCVANVRYKRADDDTVL